MPNACGRLRAAADCPSCDRSFRKQVSDRKIFPVPFDCRTYLIKMLRRQHCARSGGHHPGRTAPVLHQHCDRSIGNDRPKIPRSQRCLRRRHSRPNVEISSDAGNSWKPDSITANTVHFAGNPSLGFGHIQGGWLRSAASAALCLPHRIGLGIFQQSNLQLEIAYCPAG
jgi:hypothetical protein